MPDAFTSIELKLEQGQRTFLKNAIITFAIFIVGMVVQRFLASGKLHPYGFPWNMTMLLSLSSCWLYTHHRGRLEIASRWALSTFCLVFMGLDYLAGGLETPVLMIGIAIPVLAIVLCGVRTSLLFTGIVAAYYLLVGIVTSSQGHFGLTPLISGEKLLLGRVPHSMGMMYLLFWAAWYAKKTNHELLAHIRQEANTDFLTGLHNRRAIEHILQAEFRRSRRDENWLGVLVIDIDHFKQVNDKYGHHEGDRCLIHVAAILKELLQRPGDTAGRFGGEEFLCVLPGTPPNGAYDIAEKIRSVIALRPCRLENGHLLNLTVTIGVQSAFGKEQVKLHELIQGADQLLYKGKAAGRNRVMVHKDKIAVLSSYRTG